MSCRGLCSIWPLLSYLEAQKLPETLLGGHCTSFSEGCLEKLCRAFGQRHIGYRPAWHCCIQEAVSQMLMCALVHCVLACSGPD